MEKHRASILPLKASTSSAYNAEAEKESNVIGQRIDKARRDAGLSMSELSAALRIYGVTMSASGVGKWVQGKALPNAYHLIALCYALKIEDGVSFFTRQYVPALNNEGIRKVQEYREDLVASGRYKPQVNAGITIEYVDMPIGNLAVSAGTGEFLDDCNFQRISSRLNIWSLGNYEYVTYDAIPLMVNSHDSSCQVVNIFETSYAQETLQLLHRYYQAGYINQDASLRTSFSRFQGEQVFLRLSTGGPDASTSYSTDFGYPIVAQQVSDSIATTESAQGGIMVVNANTKHPELCLTFLNAVNTDPEVRNLLNYGIEGVHYTLTEEDQVQRISNAYRGVPYTQGNWFILKTTVGERLDKWALYQDFNDNTAESPLLGFTPDYSACDAEFKAVSRVYEKYYASLLTGTVDPEQYLPKLLEELESAGIARLQRTLQKQIDDWLHKT